MKQYNKTYVEYEPSGRYKETKGQKCGNCALFNEPNKCKAVDGRIDYDAHCVIWRPTAEQRGKEKWK
uniref:High potential iron-sulfur proteins family profile domain-containing protein n=1 Tax=viral metagenome TaxID=1070528 RepID=A0A6H1ZY93_9ZZZZ